MFSTPKAEKSAYNPFIIGFVFLTVKAPKRMLMWYFSFTETSAQMQRVLKIFFLCTPKIANEKLKIAGARCSVSKAWPSNNKRKLRQHADFISTELQTFNYGHTLAHTQSSHSQIRLFRPMGAEIWSLI